VPVLPNPIYNRDELDDMLSDTQLAAIRDVVGQDEIVEELRQQYENPAPVRLLGHALADARSLAMHRLIAERLEHEPQLVAAALRRVQAWLAEGRMHPEYAKAWTAVLEGPLERLLDMLRDPGEKGCALRQCTPFVGVLDQRTRLRIWRDVRERMAS
jgi:hypothetical protein